MHGLVNRSIECFLRDTYGAKTWGEIALAAGLGNESFEALQSYDDAVTDTVLAAACAQLRSPREMVLEDLGTYLISNPNVPAVRRLLRFGGETFADFLQSLNELQDRARLAVHDLALPSMELCDHSDTRFSLLLRHDAAGFGHVMVGVLRAMADDYGSLAYIEFEGRRDGGETITIELLETGFAEGREFALAEQAG